MNADKWEDVIKQLIPASPVRPLLILSVFEDAGGWWRAFAEPVTALALVERRHYVRAIDDLPGDPRARRRFLREVEQFIEPTSFDPGATTGVSTLSEQSFGSGFNERVHVVPGDIDWEDLFRLVEETENSVRRARARREKAKAERAKVPTA
jgi:hypothetical protein